MDPIEVQKFIKGFNRKNESDLSLPTQVEPIIELSPEEIEQIRKENALKMIIQQANPSINKTTY